MFKAILAFFVLAIAACNSGPQSTSSKDSIQNANTSTAKSYTWPADEEKEFLSGCVDSAKVKLGEAAAYAQCKCMLNQLKQNYPNMDSAAPALMDVKRVAEMAAKCK
jgi:hypothetical protein